MNQHDSHVIRTLTEAMMNANSMNDSGLQKALRDQIFSMIAPQAPEAATAEEEEVVNEQPMTKEQFEKEKVLNFIGDKCTCCVIFDTLRAGDIFPLGDEQFVYALGHLAGYEELSAIMRSVAVKFRVAIDEMTDRGEKQALADRMAIFTRSSVAARDRLADDGVAPASSPENKEIIQQSLAGLEVLQALRNAMQGEKQ